MMALSMRKKEQKKFPKPYIYGICALVLAVAVVSFLFREPPPTLDKANQMILEGKAEKAVPILRKLIENNDINASKRLGYMYLEGDGVPKNIDNAISYLLPLANAGNAKIAKDIGDIYYHGIGERQDYLLAQRFLRIAADKGDAEAMRMLGDIDFEGKISASNIDAAIQLYSKAMNSGDMKSRLSLGLIYAYGHDKVKPDPAKALSILLPLASDDIPEALITLGKLYFNGNAIGKDYELSAKFLSKAGDALDDDAKGMMAYMLYHGKGLSRDPDAALGYLDNNYSPPGLYTMGKIYIDGEVLKEDQSSGLSYLRMASAFGFHEAHKEIINQRDIMRQKSRQEYAQRQAEYEAEMRHDKIMNRLQTSKNETQKHKTHTPKNIDVEYYHKETNRIIDGILIDFQRSSLRKQSIMLDVLLSSISREKDIKVRRMLSRLYSRASALHEVKKRAGTGTIIK